MISSNIISAIIEVLGQHSAEVSRVVKVREVGGGCINRTYSVITNAGVFFVKLNSASLYPGMFEAEAQGLNLLAASSGLTVPAVIGFGGVDGTSFLVLEFIESGTPQVDFWENFGRGLAKLHKAQHSIFGLDHNNYIGSLEQSNLTGQSWIDFFVSQRIMPQIRLAKPKGLMPGQTENWFNKLFGHLADFFPKEPPSLLHGDLWSGNYMVGVNGRAVIIDPAVYFGHRYMDLGMTKLFGGFPESFYRFYHEEFPLQNHWQQGLDVANLYPLMVHVNLFGSSYLKSVNQTLERIANHYGGAF